MYAIRNNKTLKWVYDTTTNKQQKTDKKQALTWITREEAEQAYKERNCSPDYEVTPIYIKPLHSVLSYTEIRDWHKALDELLDIMNRFSVYRHPIITRTKQLKKPYELIKGNPECYRQEQGKLFRDLLYKIGSETMNGFTALNLPDNEIRKLKNRLEKFIMKWGDYVDLLELENRGG